MNKKREKKWVRKPIPEYINTKRLHPDRIDQRVRSRSASSIATNSLSNIEEQYYREQVKAKESSRQLSPIPQRKQSKAPKSASNKRDVSIDKRAELPHQKHYDFRRLKKIFSCPRRYYDRLERDRETLTQYEKEQLLLEKMKKGTKSRKQQIIAMGEKELKVHKGMTLTERSNALLKQVSMYV